MRGWRWISIFWLVLMLPSCLPQAAMKRATPVIIQDSFTGGTPELAWRPYPYFNQDNLKGEIDPSSPEGEPGVGVLDNGKAGGFAALSYADTRPLEDFHLETWLHVQVTEEEKGSLNGIAFRVDPVRDKYYRFAAQFAAEPSLSLAYVGKDTRHFPVIVAEWKAAALPGGAPKRSGWHRVVIEVKNDAAEIFWNSIRLPGGPFRLDRIDSGYIGVYATYTGGRGIAETRIDGLRVRVHSFPP
ncbi:MAG: hypothetical protein ACREQ7_09460 [Candidatus Binatia bacterium]